MSRLKAGAAKICIDPTPDMFPFPPFWGVMKEEIYASMYIRALAIENEEQKFVFVVFEAGNGSERLRKEVSTKYEIPEQNFMFCSIHNHGGPSIGHARGPASSIGKNDSGERMETLIHDRAIEVIGNAIKAVRPAHFGYGEGKSYININRDLQLEDGSWSQADNYEGPSDKTLAVMKFVDDQGKLIAAVLNHCTHANTTFLGIDTDGKSKTCADFPGFTCDYLEKIYGEDAIVLWTSGAAGNQNAIQCYRGDKHYTGEENVNYSAPNGMSYLYAQYLGERHAIDANKILKTIHCDKEKIELKCAVTDIEFDGQALPEGTNHMLQTLRAQNSVKIMKKLYPDQVKDGRIVNRTLVEADPTGEKIPCELQLFILGDVALITAAAELYNQIGTLIKENSPLRKTFVITVTCGHGNHVGYVQDDSSSKYPVFQHFGNVRPGNCNKIVLNGVKKLFEEMYN